MELELTLREWEELLGKININVWSSEDVRKLNNLALSNWLYLEYDISVNLVILEGLNW